MDFTKISNFHETTTNDVDSYLISKNLKQLTTNAVIVEKPIELVINDEKRLVLFATPVNIKELIVGLLYSLGIIENVSEIVSSKTSFNKILRVEVQTKNKNTKINLQDTVINSTQGTSNIMYTKEWSKNIVPVNFSIKVDIETLQKLMKKLLAKQKIYITSRGAHGAGIFNSSSKIIAFAEDVGRHNALDKAVGRCLLDTKSLVGCGAVLTSRISFEMVAKAARAGLELIVAISAPTTLAIAMSKQWNITLCGLREKDQKINIYTHTSRIKGLD